MTHTFTITFDPVKDERDHRGLFTEVVSVLKHHFRDCVLTVNDGVEIRYAYSLPPIQPHRES